MKLYEMDWPSGLPFDSVGFCAKRHRLKMPGIIYRGLETAKTLLETLVAGDETLNAALLDATVGGLGIETVKTDLLYGCEENMDEEYHTVISGKILEEENWRRMPENAVSRAIARDMATESVKSNRFGPAFIDEPDRLQKWLKSRDEDGIETHEYYTGIHRKKIKKCGTARELAGIFEGGKFYDAMTSAYMESGIARLLDGETAG